MYIVVLQNKPTSLFVIHDALHHGYLYDLVYVAGVVYHSYRPVVIL